MNKPAVGDPAPDLTLSDRAGRPVRLAALWGLRPLVLVLIRHCGCPHAREHIVDLQRDYPRFEAAGGHVAVVTMGTPEQTSDFFGDPATPLICLADPEREAYHAYGLEQGNLWQIAGPRVWLPSIKAMVRGGIGRPVGDVLQLPGTFVIDRHGVVRYAHRPDNQAGRPSHDEIVAVLESLDR